MLDAMVEIQGDVRYFLCGLESDQTEPIDISTEEECWELTEKLMNDLDAYYSEQIAFTTPQSGYLSEEEEQYMDDYDDEEIPEREKMLAHMANHEANISTDQDPNINNHQSEQDVFDALDDMNEEPEPQVTTESKHTNTKSNSNATNPTTPSSPEQTVNTRVTHSNANTEITLSPKVAAAFMPGSPGMSIKSLPFSPASASITDQSPKRPLPLKSEASISQITITRVDDMGNETDHEYDPGNDDEDLPQKKRSVKFAPPSLDSNAKQDPKLRFQQSLVKCIFFFRMYQ